MGTEETRDVSRFRENVQDELDGGLYEVDTGALTRPLTPTKVADLARASLPDPDR